MKERFITKGGGTVWLESLPALEPTKGGYQVRYVVTLPGGMMQSFGRFKQANDLCKSFGTHWGGMGFPFGYDATTEYVDLLDMMRDADLKGMFDLCLTEDQAEAACEAYQLFHDACERYDLTHSEQSGIEYQLMLNEYFD